VPEVSVVIPAYNAGHYVPAAVESVLAQTMTDHEVIVVDDGSTDDTAETMTRFGSRVRYLRQANQGVAAARNTGIAEAHGRYIAFLDADDTWFPEKLERQLVALSARTDCRACYSAFLVVDERLSPLGVCRGLRRTATLEDLITRGNVVGSICTVLCDRSLFASAGSFDSTLSQCADWEMWIRLATRTEFLYLDEPLATYRQHAANMSRDPALLERDSIAVLEKSFALPALPNALRRRRRSAFGRNYMVLAGTYFRAGHGRDFLRCAALSLALSPRQGAYLLAFPLRVARRMLNVRARSAKAA
jgi:glycosyltransferase involved in cell wall biosynthesis